MDPQIPQIPQLTPAQVADRAEAVLLDVREADEVAAGRIAGSTHIPLGQLAARSVELDRGRPVITVCRSGGRSSRAAQLLAAQGYDVADLAGGMTAWTADGRPVATR
ncbi:rhodanese-like domain-containing protein [Modestobacter roseus]|uniref:Rhodanese-related sulfurtransferase n=1 Tax=Modestobacter roseus TaxID=1181884 RepID=A0A562IPN8_9ACTN|nr:rhodanese-like domain-containing protein [Modestobacter roseus]MQA35417.1 rhodanese-like domain-containing protein [Modestobacter roseus]TWH72683.1 rhodanese-related sulfurtransferase [Modestobacter roseus]